MVVKFSTMNGPTQTQLFYCCAVKMCFSKARWWNQTEGERRAALLVIMARRVAMGVGGGYLTPPPVRRSRWSGPGPLKCLFVSDYKLQRRPPRFPPQRSHKSASAALFSPRAPFFAIKIGRWCVYLKHFSFFFHIVPINPVEMTPFCQRQHNQETVISYIVIYLMKCIAIDSIQPESKICETTGLIRNLI